MRYLTILFVACTLLAVSSCQSGSLSQPHTTSEIHVFNSVTGAEIADGSTITLNTTAPLNTRQLKVMRTVHSDTAADVTTDVTATADYNSSDVSILQISQEGSPTPGKLEAKSAGTAAVEVVFGGDNADPTDDDHVNFTVNVVTP